MTDQRDNEPPGHKLHRLVTERMQKTGETDYGRAFNAVLREPENLALVLEYQRCFNRPKRR